MQRSLFYSFVLSILFVASCKEEDALQQLTVTPNDFLSGDRFNQLIIEFQFTGNFGPTAEAKQLVKTFLEQRLNKPNGITITENTIFTPGKVAYSIEDIRAVETANRTVKTEGAVLTAYIFFAEGEYAGNTSGSKVLGVQYAATSMAIFEKTIRDYSDNALTEPPRYKLEAAVILHELGHTLGLVNNGTSVTSGHEDTAHEKHCNNQNCLMYYAAETSDIVANLFDGDIPSLDAECLADLKANGGK